MRTWNNLNVEINTSCPTISKVKWFFIKAEKNISKNTLKQFNGLKISLTSSDKSAFSYYYDSSIIEKIVAVLKSDKDNSFELCYNVEDRQYGMTVNLWPSTTGKALSSRYFQYESYGSSCHVPITKKQEASIIKIGASKTAKFHKYWGKVEILNISECGVKVKTSEGIKSLHKSFFDNVCNSIEECWSEEEKKRLEFNDRMDNTDNDYFNHCSVL